MTEIVLGAGIVILLIVLLTLALLATRQRLIPPEAVRVTVNGRQQIAASRGDRLLGVLHGADIGIPAACGGSGTCGLCRVEVRGEGAGVAQATEKGILSAAERKAHIRLACQTTLRGSCEVTVPDALLGATGFTCRVISNRQLAPLIRELVLELPAEQPFDFRAGSFLQLTAPPYELDFSHIRVEDRFRDIWELADWPQMRSVSAEPVTRAYSIANRPEDVGRVVFNIRLAVPPPDRSMTCRPGWCPHGCFRVSPATGSRPRGHSGIFTSNPPSAR